MRFLVLEDVPLDRAATVYRDASWRALGLVALIMTAVPMVIVWANPHDKNNVALVTFTGLVALFFFALFLHRFTQAVKRDNWLLAVAEEGLYLNFRHHRHRANGGGEPGAVLIPRNTIAAVGKTHETRQFEGRYSHERHFAYIDIYLTHEDTAALRRALREERRRMPAGKDLTCPVRLPVPGVVRILWDRVHPPENRAIQELAGNYTTMADRSVRYADWENLSDTEKQQVIDDLWETGHVEEAIRLHRVIHKSGYREARAYFDALAREQ